MSSPAMPSRRRALAAALALLPVHAFGQAKRLPRVAYLVSGSAEHGKELGKRIEARLATNGVKAQVRMFFAENDAVATLNKAARDAVAWPPDVILAPGPATAQAARAATTDIPIVFYGIPDPDRFGLVRSLARPGGNVTGAATQAGNITVKRLELVRDLLPKANRVTILTRRRAGSNLALLEQIRGQLGELGARLGLQLEDADVDPRGLRATLEAIARRPAEALVAFGPYAWDPGGIDYGAAIKLLVDFERNTRCVVIHDGQRAMELGAIVAMYDTGNQINVAIEMMARVLRGATPATMPVDTGTTYALAVNPTAAQALGHVLPQSVMIRAEVVKG